MRGKPQSSDAWRGPSRCWRGCPAAGPVRAARRPPAAARGAAPPLPAAVPPPCPSRPPPGHPAASLRHHRLLCLVLSPSSVQGLSQSSRAVHRPCCTPPAPPAPAPPGTAHPGRSCRPRCSPPLPTEPVLVHAHAHARARVAPLPPLQPVGGGTPQPPRLPQPAVPPPRLQHCPQRPGPPSQPSPASQTAQSRTGTRRAPWKTRCARSRPRACHSRREPPPRAVPLLPCAVLLLLLLTHSPPVPVLPCSVQSPRVHVRAVQSQGPSSWAHHRSCRSVSRHK